MLKVDMELELCCMDFDQGGFLGVVLRSSNSANFS